MPCMNNACPYEEVATHVLDVADKTPEEIVEMIRCL